MDPRDWSKDTLEYRITQVQTPFADPPKVVHQLGLNSHVFEPRLDTYTTIPSGPNEGVAYFLSMPFRLIFEVSYNTNAMRIGSGFFLMQPTSNRTLNGVTYCGRSRITSDVPLLKAHEGFSANDKNSHTEVYLRYFLQEARVPSERMVAASISDLAPSDVGKAAHDVASLKSAYITDSTAANPYKTNCVFNYDPTRSIP